MRRRIALLACVLAGLAGGAVAPPAAHAGCASVVVWHDRAYWGFGGGPVEPDGRKLAGAVQPGCNDTVGANEHPSPVTARSIPGIPSAVAIVAEGQTLVGSGYLIETTDLHAGDAAQRIRDETRGCTLGGPVRITGRAHIGFGLLDVSVKDSTVRLHHLTGGGAQIFADGHTRFEGLTRNSFRTSVRASSSRSTPVSARCPTRSERRSSPVASPRPGRSSRRPRPRTCSAPIGAGDRVPSRSGGSHTPSSPLR